MTLGTDAFEEASLEEAIRTLSRLLLAEESLEDTLSRVAGLACRTLPGCGAASLTMIRDGRASTAVQTDPEIGDLDAAQYAAGAGPCMEAYQARRIVRLDVTAATERWPDWCTQANRSKVKSVLCVPLVVGHQAVGALNLFSQESDGFSEADVETARLFSEQAAVACTNAEVYWRTYTLTENLREALESRDAIGQAKGILMARRGCTADAAFEALRQVSQRRNIKLRDVADSVVYTGELVEDEFGAATAAGSPDGPS